MLNWTPRLRQYFLLGVLIIGLCLRVFSINYGLPYVVGPDETRQILDAFSMGARLSLMPLEFTYAALHKYILLFVYGVYFVIGKIFGIFSDRNHFVLKFITEPYNFYLYARLLSALFGTATIFIVYKIGEKLFGFREGALAVIFATLNFHLIQLSYWATSDILVVFLSTVAFLFIYYYLIEQKFNYALWASFFAGLAFSSKLQGFFLIFPLIMAHIFVLPKRNEKVKILFCSIVLFFISSLIGNFSYILKTKEALSRIFALFGESQFGISSAPIFSHNFFSASFWYLKELIRQDGLIGLWFCFGIAYSMIKHRKEDLIFIFSILVFLVSFSRSSLRFLYYGAFLFPISAVFTARFFWHIEKISAKFGRIIIVFLTLLTLIFSSTISIVAIYKRMQPDTRQLAKLWIEDNISTGTTLAMDWYELNVPLESEIPFMFRTGSALKYYDAYVNSKIKDSYKTQKGRKRYNIIPIIYEKEENFWPEEMTRETIEKAEKIPIVKRLYQNFNFKNIQELKNNGTRYIILSSFSYSHFLLDNDSNKTSLFNPYINEDTLSNNRQSQGFSDQVKENILYFLSKRARDFYLPILKLEQRNLRLIKEISPESKQFGPIIKIYALE